MFEAGDLNSKEVRQALSTDPEIKCHCVHDLHIWKIGDVPCLTVHFVVETIEQQPIALLRTYKLLKERFDIEHVTIQIEVQGRFDHTTMENYGGLHGPDHYAQCCIDGHHSMEMAMKAGAGNKRIESNATTSAGGGDLFSRDRLIVDVTEGESSTGSRVRELKTNTSSSKGNGCEAGCCHDEDVETGNGHSHSHGHSHGHDHGHGH